MSNILVLQGRLTKDPELRYTQSGTAVTDINIAVSKKFKKEEGANADFFKIKLFGKTAEATANYTTKGSNVMVIGRIENNNYENSEGKKVYQDQIIANEITFLDSKSKSKDQDAPETQNEATQSEFSEQDIPF